MLQKFAICITCINCPLRSAVSFSVENDAHSFNEVVSMVRDLNATLSLLGYNVLDIEQGVVYVCSYVGIIMNPHSQLSALEQCVCIS